MAEHTTTQCLLFPDIFPKSVVAQFDQPQGSSDGGAILLRAADRRLRLTRALAACLEEKRQAGKVQHALDELLTQRVMAIACGYEDANDAARLASDPVHKLLVGRDPIEGEDLASQPTLSRFEHAPDRPQLFRLADVLAERVIDRHRRRLHGRARRITIDLDPTDDPTHGAQQLALFNGHYDTWCYLPLLGFLTFNEEPEQYLFTAVLRSGKAVASLGARGILRRLLKKLRRAFPGVRMRIRLDGGFAEPALLDFLEAQPDVEYVVAMAKNAVLKRKAKRAMRQARRLSRRTQKTEHVYAEAEYAARTWSHRRRVILKAEVVRQTGKDPKDNPRFVITNLRQSPQWIYEQVYCQRGDIENRIKELHEGLQIGRTSCTRFGANQFRVLMTAAAYVLMQELRLRAARTDCARAQVWTLRERLLKLGARVVRSVRRVVLHLPHSFPFLDTFHRVALALGARAG
ncbi:MAG TPA: IS1380 family transposase [Candidatus Binatia bacterium]|nr:IS1380 family transposase [Candidatus Binatia bacterium]